MPFVSPLKDTITGDTYDSIDIAKRSAAMKACIELYEIGELDENLLPSKVENSKAQAQHFFSYMEDEEQSPEAMPDTTSGKIAKGTYSKLRAGYKWEPNMHIEDNVPHTSAVNRRRD